MLPARSKRYASADGEIPRQVLTGPWQLILIAVLVLTLLVVIFPHRRLVETLYEQKNLDELTLSYIQNLYRVEPNNADVALLLAHSQGGAVNLSAFEANLLLLVEQGTPRQQQEAMQILFDAYDKRLALANKDNEPRNVRSRLIALLQKASHQHLSESMAQTFAGKSFELNLPELGLAYLQQVHQSKPLQVLEAFGDQALARGDYAVAASYFLMARDGTNSVVEARRLFQKGVQTYMADSQFKPAMRAAQDHLGDLATDLPTLRFLARSAAAAGESALAAEYARQLVFRNEPSVAP
jgi:hypothetical protein